MCKISVIIPKLNKHINILSKLAAILNVDDAVSEIIIINNSLQPLNLDFSKIKIHTPDENLYVNKSWNFGISLIKNEKFLIINDDILCCENYCTRVLETSILDEEQTGLVGISIEYINQNDRGSCNDLEIPQVSPNIEVEIRPMNKILYTGDWGSAFFGCKRNYYEIPENLKIIFGDNYLLKQNINAGKINYGVAGLPFNHIHSLSSASREFLHIIASDIDNSVMYFN